MKQKFELIIDADRDTVWAAFENPDNLRRWQPTLASYEHRTGEPGRPGATAELVHEENGRQITMTETITECRKPDFKAGIYETNHGTTLTFHTFERIDDHRTRWSAWSNMSFKGVMKFMSIFQLKRIRRRAEDDMQRFKLMVETDLANSSS